MIDLDMAPPLLSILFKEFLLTFYEGTFVIAYLEAGIYRSPLCNTRAPTEAWGMTGSLVRLPPFLFFC